MDSRINNTVLMSGADFFDDGQAINPFMTHTEPIDLKLARSEHQAIRNALGSAGVKVLQVPPPKDCQDGIYTANWALVRGKKAVIARLPSARKAEEPYAAKVLQELGKEIIYFPEGLKFSGQGDALPCGNYLLAGQGYRSDVEIHKLLYDTLGYEVISLQTVPLLDDKGLPVVNKSSGWPDSFFYDIDLAISILHPGLICWCPEAFTPESQDKISALPMNKIEVSLDEAMNGFACNLVSTGSTVIMSAEAPKLKEAIISNGLRVITPNIHELKKGGGFIRCITLTLS